MNPRANYRNVGDSVCETIVWEPQMYEDTIHMGSISWSIE